MLDPAQKANQLIEKFWLTIPQRYEPCTMRGRQLAIRHAIQCVEEIIEAEPLEPTPQKYYETLSDITDEATEYWNQVLKHIQSQSAPIKTF